MKRAGIVVAVLGALAGTGAADVAPASTDTDTFDLLAQASARSHAGDHAGAIELYERAYQQDPDLDLLVVIGSEYRKAGKLDQALQNLCAYLTIEPQGDSAAIAESEVVGIEAGLGRRLGGNVCAPAEPMLPPIEMQTAPREQPTTNSSLSQREIAGIATGAAGVAGLIAGLYYGARAKDVSDEIASHDPGTPWSADIKDVERRGEHLENMEKVFLLGGALATATGVVLYATGHSHRIANERVSISPALLRQGGGLAVRGAF